MSSESLLYAGHHMRHVMEVTGLPTWRSGKEFACQCRRCGFDPWGSEGEDGNLLQYSCLGNATDRGAWQAAVHGVSKSQTRLSNFPFTFHFHALEKEMATHSSVLAWRIPGTGECGGLPSMGWHRVGHGLKRLSSSAISTTTFVTNNGVLSLCYT